MRKMKKSLSLALGFLVVSLALRNFIVQVDASPSEPPILEWDRTYGGAMYDRAYSVVQTEDGGYAIAGHTESFGAGLCDFWLVKADASGNMLWNKTYGGAKSEIAGSLVQTSDGGYALAGEVGAPGVRDRDGWVVKVDSHGNMEWNKTYGGGDCDTAQSIIRTSDGGYAIAGGTYSYAQDGDGDAWLVKTDANGNIQWHKPYSKGKLESAYCVIQTSDEGYALAGFTGHTPYYDFWLIKTNASGNVQWDQTYGGENKEEAYSVVQTSDGGYVVAGFTDSFGAGSSDFWLVKTDANGNEQWDKTYGGEGDDHGGCVVLTRDGGYAIAGYTESFGAGGRDFWLVRVDPFGNMQWNMTLGGGGTDGQDLTPLIQTIDGGYAIAGLTESFGAGSADFWLIKIATEREPTKWAVVIGVDEYWDPKLNTHGGQGNSAMDVYDILVDHMSFPSENVHLLVDRVGVSDDDVTKAMVEGELAWLQSISIPKDIVVFYYAGHGGQSQPFEYILTHNNIIWDADFAVEIDKIKSQNLVVILDISFGGGFITDGQTLWQGILGIVPSWTDLAEETPNGRIVLTACAENVGPCNLRNAREWPLWPKKLRYEAVFTHYLVEGFSGSADANSDGKVTVEEAFRYARRWSLWSQTPMIYDGYPEYEDEGELFLGN